MKPSPLATAHQEWDRRWRSPADQDEWLRPEDEVIELAARLRLGGAGTALDLGCGLGRHTLALARLGFAVQAVDGAAAGLDHVRSIAGDLAVQRHIADFRQLPLVASSVDLVVCWNVIYHGTRDDLALAVAEIARVLRPGGTFLATLLSKRNAACGRGAEVAPDTWVNVDDPEKAHAHCYTDAADVTSLLMTDFDLRRLVDVEHRTPGSWHWHFVAERR